MDPVQMIRIRRSGERAHTAKEMEWFIKEYTAGNIPEYQMAAWLMATCFQPLTPTETAILTQVMVQSTPGGPLQWQQQQQPPQQQQQPSTNNNHFALVDKHSTGGVGDKVSLILAPLCATLGLYVPMIAGRGLGHTGGTIDKLESISGFRTRLSMKEFQETCYKVKCCVAAAGPEFCPADQKLYALRDVTCTVQNIGLQTASIMCKKIAEHPNSLLLDVKYGSGAFQSNVEQAAELATSMVFTGQANGLHPTTALLTRMHQPLGYAIGNWYEVQESFELLQGHWQRDDNSSKLHTLSYDLIALVSMQAGQMLLQSGIYPNQTLDELTQLAYDTLYQGQAWPKFVEMALAQGADATGVDRQWYPEQLYEPVLVYANCSGRITAMDTMELGWIAVALGAGRREADDTIDPYAGICLRHKIGSIVSAGDVLMELYYSKTNRQDKENELTQRAAACITILPNETEETELFVLEPVVTHIVTVNEGVCEFGCNNDTITTTGNPGFVLPSLVQTLYRDATHRCNNNNKQNKAQSNKTTQE